MRQLKQRPAIPTQTANVSDETYEAHEIQGGGKTIAKNPVLLITASTKPLSLTISAQRPAPAESTARLIIPLFPEKKQEESKQAERAAEEDRKTGGVEQSLSSKKKVKRKQEKQDRPSGFSRKTSRGSMRSVHRLNKVLQFPVDNSLGCERYEGDVVPRKSSKAQNSLDSKSQDENQVDKSAEFSTEFDEDFQMEGKGKLFFLDGSSYVGELVNDKMEGLGTFLDLSRKLKYVGHWKEGQPNGFGKFQVSPMQAGAATGRRNTVLDALEIEKLAFHCFVSPGPGYMEEYSGGFSAGRLQGVGFAKFSNGAKYEGDWEDNHCSGRGVMTYFNGDSFEGLFAQNKRQGPGTYNVFLHSSTSEASYGQLVLTYKNNVPRLVYYISKGLWACFMVYSVYWIALPFLTSEPLEAGSVDLRKTDFEGKRRGKDLSPFVTLLTGSPPLSMTEALDWFDKVSHMYSEYFSLLRGLFFLLFKRHIVLVSAEMIETFALFFVARLYLEDLAGDLWLAGCFFGSVLNILITLIVWFG